MDSFSLWIEFDTWERVPQYEGDDTEKVRTAWLYNKQSNATKQQIERIRKEDANYLINLASSIRKGIKQPIIVLNNYSIYDGLHRLIAAMDSGIEEVLIKMKN